MIIISLINLRKGWLPLIKKVLVILVVMAVLYAAYRLLGPANPAGAGVSTVFGR